MADQTSAPDIDGEVNFGPSHSGFDRNRKSTSSNEEGSAADSSSGTGAEAPQTEAPDTADVTTVKEYKYVSGRPATSSQGTSQYKWDATQKVLRFSYNVWAGWLPVIAANHGTKPNAESVFSKKYGFKVEMVLMDDPWSARDAFAAGKSIRSGELWT